jgi:hypothetical protein
MTAEERRQTIESRKENTGRKFRLWCKGQFRDFEVFRVPVDALLLNVDNRRFAAERKVHEDQLAHSLDPENNKDDELSIISMLLDIGWQVDGSVVRGKPSKNFELLRSDWQTRHQETPFWIRPDGTVRNGNRRLAMIHRLVADAGAAGNDWIDTIILDKEINEDDLFEMEQREQLTENLKVRYTDINLLLALRDAALSHDIDWADPQSVEIVAGLLQHAVEGDKDYALMQLNTIKYMDAYLADAGKPGQHQTLLKQVERFRDVGKIMSNVDADYPDDSADMLRLAFAAIRAGLRHTDIRSLKKIFLQDRTRYNTLVREIENDEKEWDQAGDTQLVNPDLSAIGNAEDDEDGEADNPPGPVVSKYPVEKVKERIKNSIDGFLSSQVENVHSALSQVWNRLEPIDAGKLKTAIDLDGGTELDALIARIAKWAKAAELALKK